jgi:alpha-glucosidase
MRKTFSIIVFLIILLAFSKLSLAAWQTIGNVTTYTKQTNGITISTTSGAKISVTLFQPAVVRVRLAPKGIFEPDFSYAIDYSRDRHTAIANMRETRDAIEITNPLGTKVIIRRANCLVSIYDKDNNLIVEDDAANPLRFNKENGAAEVSKKRTDVELYYGFGEKAMPMSRHGQSIVMWNTDTFGYPIGLDPIYQSIPFFISLKNGNAYGVFLNNTHRTYFDMGKQDPSRYTFGVPDGELDYFIFTGGKERTPKKVLQDYTELTGTTPLPPIWALGNQQSRWSYTPESKVREIANKFRENKIPIDVIYLDIDYMDGFRVFTWSNKNFPDPKKLVSDLRAQGIRTVLIIDPGIKVDENYYVYKDGVEKGMFVRTTDGKELHAIVWPGVCAFPDFTNSKVREWFGSFYQKHLDEGIAGFWNDMNEPGVFIPNETKEPFIYHHPKKTFPLDAKHDADKLKGTHSRYHNVYGMQMARSTFEGLKKLSPSKRPFVLTRAGFAGIQRFSAVWTGDNVASWEHMALSIPMLTNMSVSGIPFVGADVGGFTGNPSPELYARWLQAAILTPFLRSHSELASNSQEPFAFGEEFTKINRATIELRYRFLPYLYTLFYEHERDGQPVMRPLWFGYPKDYQTYLIEDEYLVGSDLLVAPVLKEGMRKRKVYFPIGDDWLDWNTGKLYKGGTNADVDAPLDRLPLFARVGSVIPNQHAIQNIYEMKNSQITLTVIAGIAENRTEESSLFQDAGDGYDYRLAKNWRDVKIEHRRGLIKINRYGYSGEFQQIKFIEAIGFASTPKEVRIDGQLTTDFVYDEAAKRLRITLPNDSVKEITVAR